MPELSEAERVWKSQSQVRPSARSVATAMTRAGRPVHFTTVARWQRQGLLTAARAGEPPDPLAKFLSTGWTSSRVVAAAEKRLRHRLERVRPSLPVPTHSGCSAAG
jgi:hypothetical protein